MKEYFVSISGSDETGDGTQALPYRTIWRGLQGASLGSKLQPGDVLTICEGTYVEKDLVIDKFMGKPGNEITIRGFPGDRVVVDSGIEGFRVPNTGQGKWVPAQPLYPEAHDEEWVWDTLFEQDEQPNRGAFLDMPYRRLVTYSTLDDFRADNQTFGKIFNIEANDKLPGPWKVTDDKFKPLLDPPTPTPGVPQREFTVPWVYMGPGLFLFQDKETKKNRLHLRLSHTSHEIPQLGNYLGSTNPNEVPLAICERDAETLIIKNSRCLIFSNLIIRFGGRDTILIDKCHCLTFERVDVFASERGIRFGAGTDITFRNCRFDGGLPPWFFRTDLKAEYDYILTKEGQEQRHNSLGKQTMEALMHGEGYKRRNFEIHHCEFVNAHDLYLVATNMHFHHNWIDNLHDEGMVLDAQPSASGRIHSNVITRCLSPISMASDDFTAGPWFIYRNLIDLRVPTAGNRPDPPKDDETSPGPENEVVFRFGNVFKSNEGRAPDGPYDIFHNTFIVANQVGDAAYLHYDSALSPHRRRSFNNIFVSTDSDIPITFIPPPTFPGPTDGNIYYRFGAAESPAFISLAYIWKCEDVVRTTYKTLQDFRLNPEKNQVFKLSQTHQYAPGYEARSRLTHPRFRSIATDGSVGPLDDLRLLLNSPARFAAVKLPPDLRALDLATGVPNDIPSLPWPFRKKTRASGCYAIGSGPLEVGVNGQRRFPDI